MGTELIARQIELARQGPAWHGPSVQELLEGVDGRTARARPAPTVHSIWEIVLHLTAWVGEVSRRLEGGQPALPREGDWPEVADPSDQAWDEARVRLAEAHEALGEAVRRFPPARLDAIVGGERDAPLGTGVSFAEMLHGLVQHDAYHGGQIALLRKLAR